MNFSDLSDLNEKMKKIANAHYTVNRKDETCFLKYLGWIVGRNRDNKNIYINYTIEEPKNIQPNERFEDGDDFTTQETDQNDNGWRTLNVQVKLDKNGQKLLDLDERNVEMKAVRFFKTAGLLDDIESVKENIRKIEERIVEYGRTVEDYTRYVEEEKETLAKQQQELLHLQSKRKLRGHNSGVECFVANEVVEGSNPSVRSNSEEQLSLFPISELMTRWQGEISNNIPVVDGTSNGEWELRTYAAPRPVRFRYDTQAAESL